MIGKIDSPDFSFERHRLNARLSIAMNIWPRYFAIFMSVGSSVHDSGSNLAWGMLEGAGCKSPHPHLPEGRGDVFFLDILFHRKSVMASLQR